MPGKGNRKNNLSTSVRNHRGPSLSERFMQARLEELQYMQQFKMNLVKQQIENHEDLMKTSKKFLENSQSQQEKNAIINVMMRSHKRIVETVTSIANLGTELPSLQPEVVQPVVQEKVVEKKVEKERQKIEKEGCSVPGCNRYCVKEAKFCRVHKCAKCTKRVHEKHGLLCKECDA